MLPISTRPEHRVAGGVSTPLWPMEPGRNTLNYPDPPTWTATPSSTTNGAHLPAPAQVNRAYYDRAQKPLLFPQSIPVLTAGGGLPPPTYT